MERQAVIKTKPESITSSPLWRGILQQECDCGNQSAGGGECAEGGKKKELLQHRPANKNEPTEVPPIVYEVLNSPGQPLDPETHAFMELRFGHDFSQVWVHTDAKAAELARVVNAIAYTMDRNIVFGASHYVPSTIEGKMLLPYELTHTIQPTAGIQKQSNTNSL